MVKPFVGPIDFIEMNGAIFFAQTDQAVGFKCGVEGQSQTVDQLQVLPGAIPTIKQHGLGLNLFITDGLAAASLENGRSLSSHLGSGHKVSVESKDFIAKLWSMINQLVTI